MFFLFFFLKIVIANFEPVTDEAENLILDLLFISNHKRKSIVLESKIRSAISPF